MRHIVHAAEAMLATLLYRHRFAATKCCISGDLDVLKEPEYESLETLYGVRQPPYRDAFGKNRAALIIRRSVLTL